jgi:hypothetical protein
MRTSIGCMFLGLLFATAVAAKADTFTPTSGGVDYTVNTGSTFYVSPFAQGTAPAASNVQGGMFFLDANSNYGSYSDAGVVLYFNGGLTLGQLQGVTANMVQGSVDVNLWMDTSGDGQFFSFSGDQYLGTNGDSYCSITGGSVSASSACYMMAGDGAGGTYTLAQLIAGDDSGIGANTPVSLWVGITNPAGPGDNEAFISSVDVDATSATPEPSSLILLGTGFLGVVGAIRRRLM